MRRQSAHGPTTVGPPPSDDIPADRPTVIRRVETLAEYRACVALQELTWGEGFSERVPVSVLLVAQKLGGVAVAAFEPSGRIVGFVFGLTGPMHGRLVHWSDMLAVRADLQNHGLGRRLKAFQRAAVRAVGATRMYWTYDPLVARNAHFNLNRLGARVSEYVPDMYGTETGSALHSGFGTDRFIVVWPLADGDGLPPLARAADDGVDTPILNDGTLAQAGGDLTRLAEALPSRVRVEIPPDILRVQAASVERAAEWRASSRHALQWAFAHGYAVERYVSDRAASRGFYLLARG